MKIVIIVLSKLGIVEMDMQAYGSIDQDSSYQPSGDRSGESTKATRVFSGWLGLGTPKTWHGYPDACIHVGNNDITVISSVDEDPVSPVNSLLVEAKLCQWLFRIHTIL